MNRKAVIISCILVLLSLVSTGQKEEILMLQAKGLELEGTLLVPAAERQVPVVLIISGSGPTDRNGNNPMMKNNSLKLLAWALAERGIASLRYDKRGIGESTSEELKEANLRFTDYIDDAARWVEYMAQDERFSALIVLGHSEGSLIGMIASQDQSVDKFISIAGLGVPASETIRRQLKEQPPMVLEQALPILEKLENGQTVDDVPPMLAGLFRPSVQPFLISWFAYDPAKELAKLDIPVLVVQGTTDIQVRVEDAEWLVAGNPNARMRIIEEMNHVLKRSGSDRQQNIQTYNNPELPLADGLVEILSAFINE